MEQYISEAFKSSPGLALALVIFYFARKDWKEMIEKYQAQALSNQAEAKLNREALIDSTRNAEATRGIAEVNSRVLERIAERLEK